MHVLKACLAIIRISSLSPSFWIFPCYLFVCFRSVLACIGGLCRGFGRERLVSSMLDVFVGTWVGVPTEQVCHQPAAYSMQEPPLCAPLSKRGQTIPAFRNPCLLPVGHRGTVPLKASLGAGGEGCEKREWMLGTGQGTSQAQQRLF